MKLIALLALLVITQAARGRDVGVSYYAMPGFSDRQCAAALRVFDGVQRPSLATLWGSFGDRVDCFDRFLDLPQEQKIFLIHSTNETCRRPPRYCTKYDRPNFARRIEEIARFIESRNRSGVEWLVTLGLEDDLSTSSLRRRAQAARAALPSYVLLVRNRNGGTRNNGGVDLLEHHSLRIDCRPASRCIFNNDGVDFRTRRSAGLQGAVDAEQMFASFRRNRNRYAHLFLWWSAPQGNIRGRWLEPRRRSYRIYREDVVLINRFLRELNQ